jgi:hypothetical protein
MGEPFATSEDVNALYPLDAQGAALATALLTYASALMRQAQPDLDARISAGLDPTLAQFVAVSMVIRVLRNIDAMRQQTVGPYTAAYDPVEASGKLALTPDDLARIAPAPTGVGAATARLDAGLGYGREGIIGDRRAYGPHRRWDGGALRPW